MQTLSPTIIEVLTAARNDAQRDINRRFMSYGPGADWERFKTSDMGARLYRIRDEAEALLEANGYKIVAGNAVEVA